MTTQTRREFLKTLGAAAGFSLLGGGIGRGQGAGATGRPNILFIMTDDHASHAMSCYGSKINQTPNLDRIASEGMRFTNSFCTNSICAPCRAVILTGKYSHLNGLIDNNVTFDGSQQTFPKLLRQAGYETAIIGKWHLKSDPTGFDYWNILPGQGVYYNPVTIEMGQQKKHEGYVTDILTDYAIDWMKGRKEGKPFCLMFHHKAPHREWEPGPKYLTLYDDVEIPEPATLFDDNAGRGRAAKEQDMTIEKTLTRRDLKLVTPGKLTPEQQAKWDAAYGPKIKAFEEANLQGKDLVRWKYQRYIKDYLRCIASVDDSVGRVLEYLDQSGLAQNTVVIYTSDQGFYLGDHGWFDKRFMYEISLRMPLLVRYPKEIRAGSVNSDIVLNLDFAETFLDWAGASVPADMQGRSLRPLLQGRTPSDWRTSMYYHYYEYPAVHSVKRHYGVRTERYKLIHFYNDIDEWELYDLQTDPDERQNVYNDPKYAEIVTELKAELKRLRAQYNDTTGAPV
ncbi:MAG TPA: sulfatase [Sedimentisphaerales bacterium]|nr:sulfatase [Sedimentisphaerales bacterium]HNU31256.1 sulfatase [Sedimentisphaerales bacterium]